VGGIDGSGNPDYNGRGRPEGRSRLFVPGAARAARGSGWGFRKGDDLPTKISTARQLAVSCARLAADKKAADIAILDIGPLLRLTDYFVIATCTNPRQVRAIADDLVHTLKQQGIRCLGQEGRTDTNWILLDFGDVVVHIFGEEQRRFYDLEGLWADAKRIAWERKTRSRTSAKAD
jgi:ribosome-associated protein